MHSSQFFNPSRKYGRRHPASLRCGLLLAGSVLLSAGLAPLKAVSQSNPNTDKPDAVPAANRLPGPNGQMKSDDSRTTSQNVDPANAQRKKELSDDSAELLTLAVALKAEVDKTNKDTLSLNVIRKAEEIEKLAHSVKEKMRASAGGS
jgi:hypothetical protein